MQKIRIHLQDLSFIDTEMPDSQAEEFIGWMRFAQMNWTYTIPGTDKKILRKDISRTEIIRESLNKRCQY
ncbi:MAG: hypothetical protein IKS55_10185 [Oscillospiraceae bacterium]|nr:hypothetical protein [Oscillospiraceae bacterium]